mmetsp:Transcript_23189/g.57711  ORF Transcript_23189/g.57711 Transcript_23189/m.57711 type:complete len:216 (+) Transcript_23189:959-1606(+)
MANQGNPSLIMNRKSLPRAPGLLLGSALSESSLSEFCATAVILASVSCGSCNIGFSFNFMPIASNGKSSKLRTTCMMRLSKVAQYARVRPPRTTSFGSPIEKTYAAEKFIKTKFVNNWKMPRNLPKGVPLAINISAVSFSDERVPMSIMKVKTSMIAKVGFVSKIVSNTSSLTTNMGKNNCRTPTSTANATAAPATIFVFHVPPLAALQTINANA